MEFLTLSVSLLRFATFAIAMFGLLDRTFHMTGGVWDLIDADDTRRFVYLFAFFGVIYHYLKLKKKADAAGTE